MTFFDWAKWELTTEYNAITDIFAEALHQSGIVETLFDDDHGIIWVLALPPIPRTVGHSFIESFVPQAMDGFRDFLKFLSEESADREKRPRNPPSPVPILRDNISRNFSSRRSRSASPILRCFTTFHWRYRTPRGSRLVKAEKLMKRYVLKQFDVFKRKRYGHRDRVLRKAD
jgi:hypothetical protein